MHVSIFSFLVFLLIPLLASATVGSSPLIYPNPTPGGRFVLQGVCTRHGIEPSNPQIDLSLSTWACNGASDKMLRIFYQQGPQECVYIDNFNNDGGQIKAFFVPLATSEEWMAFRANRPGGVNLRYGCPGVILKDPCGNEFALPDSPASDNDTVKISTTGDYTVSYECPYTLSISDAGRKEVRDSGCGEWKKKEEKGSCE